MLKIDLACGNNKKPGFTGIDFVKTDSTDIIHDLTKAPWPLEDSSVDEAHCSHFIEHLTGDDFIVFMEELWRVLKPNAQATLIAPYYTSQRHAQDPTHKQPICENKFHYFTKKWREAYGLTHYPIKSNFAIKTDLVVTNPAILALDAEQQTFARQHYWNVVDDIVAVVTKIDDDQLERSPDSYSERLTDDYQRLLKGYNLLPENMAMFQQLMGKWRFEPLFLIAIYARPGDYGRLADTIESLQKQIYPLWRLLIVAEEPCPESALAEVPNIDWRICANPTDPVERKTIFDQAIAEQAADLLTFVFAGSFFNELSLWRIAQEFNSNESIAALYTDDDVLRDHNQIMPRFKPDVAIDYLRNHDYIGNLWIYSVAYQVIGGYSELSGAANYDLTLRLLDKTGPAAIAHLALPMLSLPFPPAQLIDRADAMAAVAAHLVRRQITARIMPGFLDACWRIEPAIAPNSSVDIIIPIKDQIEFLEPLIHSIFGKTEHSDFTVWLIDNASVDPETQHLINNLAQQYGARLKHHVDSGLWNIPRLFNLGSQLGSATYLLFLQHDTQILSPQWLERLLGLANQPDIAAVAPRQIRPGENTIDFAGSVFGLGSLFGRPHADTGNIRSPGYLGRLLTDQNYLALDAACLICKRAVFTSAGEFTDQLTTGFAGEWSTRAANYGRLLMTPGVTIGNYRQAAPSDTTALETVLAAQLANHQATESFIDKHWPVLGNDPYWNKNLSSSDHRVSVDYSCPLTWNLLPNPDVPRILADVTPGAGDIRIVRPLMQTVRENKALVSIFRMANPRLRRNFKLTDLNRLDQPDSCILHHNFGEDHIKELKQIRRHLPNQFIVMQIDDLATAVPPESNVFQYWSRDTRTRVRQALALVDRVVVSTPALADFTQNMCSDIRIVPNRLEGAVWQNLSSQRRSSKKPRVGWAGAQQHAADLALILDTIRETADEVDWIFFGMQPKGVEHLIAEYHDFVSYTDYPAKLASLNLDIAMAPLEDNRFNECKSNLRLIDYGFLGWPVICSDVVPFRLYDAPVKRVKNTTETWLSALRERIHDMEATYREGDALKAWVNKLFVLENHTDDWLKQHLR